MIVWLDRKIRNEKEKDEFLVVIDSRVDKSVYLDVLWLVDVVDIIFIFFLILDLRFAARCNQ